MTAVYKKTQDKFNSLKCQSCALDLIKYYISVEYDRMLTSHCSPVQGELSTSSNFYCQFTNALQLF